MKHLFNNRKALVGMAIMLLFFDFGTVFIGDL